MGRLETAKSQVQLRMKLGNSSNASDTHPKNSGLLHLAPLTSHNSALIISASSSGLGSKISINQNTTHPKKMVENEMEGVQFNRKRMNSSISNSSAGRSLSGDPAKYGDQVMQ